MYGITRKPLTAGKQNLFVFFVLLLSCGVVSAQDDKPSSAEADLLPSVTKGFILKTNIANLYFARPTLSVEKFLQPRMSLEASCIPGLYKSVISIGERRRTTQLGFVLRAKFLFTEVKPGSANLYLGAYAGTLRRYRRAVPTAYYPSIDEPRSYKLNSIRAGGTFGCHFLEKNSMVIDTQVSFGYGQWLEYNKHPDYRPPEKERFDFQVWACFGYHFMRK